jgi:F-type H+-transporting ATPase subunit gamma
MKMVSAAKLRKAQDAIVKLRPYAVKMTDILSSINDSLKEDEDNPYVVEKVAEKVLLIVISSSKGLCGAFNSNIIKAVNHLVDGKYATQSARKNLHLIIIGKKAFDHFKKRDITIVKNRGDIYDNLSYENVSELASEIIDRFVSGEYDKIDIIYNQFVNAAVHNLRDEQFLPLEVQESKENLVKSTYFDFIFEP